VEAAALKQTVGRSGRPAVVDMTGAQVRDIDPGFCRRLQGLGLTEPVLCGPYLNRTLGELAEVEHLDVQMLLEAIEPEASSSAEKAPIGQRDWPGPRLAEPVAQFNLQRELELLRAEDAWQEFDRNAKTLVKNPELRVVLIALKADARLEQHWAAGPVTVQALTGRVRLHLPETVLDLPAGELASIGAAIRHDLEALEPSAVLLTIAFPPPAETHSRSEAHP
jgi:quercetin dioxygenase-like cupin family protein